MEAGEEGGKLPLADEAEAREKWRRGETMIGKGEESTGMPASEVDNAATGDGQESDPASTGRPGRAPGNIPPPD